GATRAERKENASSSASIFPLSRESTFLNRSAPCGTRAKAAAVSSYAAAASTSREPRLMESTSGDLTSAAGMSATESATSVVIPRAANGAALSSAPVRSSARMISMTVSEAHVVIDNDVIRTLISRGYQARITNHYRFLTITVDGIFRGLQSGSVLRIVRRKTAPHFCWKCSVTTHLHGRQMMPFAYGVLQ